MPVFWMRLVTMSLLVLIASAAAVASFGFLHPFSTAVADPPRLPDAFAPAVHCGSGATAHLPEAPGAFFWISAVAQTAPTKEVTRPSWMSLYQAVSNSGSLTTAFLSSRPCQYWATFWVSGLSMVTCQALLAVPNHLPPACQVSAPMS